MAYHKRGPIADWAVGTVQGLMIILAIFVLGFMLWVGVTSPDNPEFDGPCYSRGC